MGGGGFRLKFSNASNNSSLELETVVTLEIRLCLWLPGIEMYDFWKDKQQDARKFRYSTLNVMINSKTLINVDYQWESFEFLILESQLSVSE